MLLRMQMFSYALSDWGVIEFKTLIQRYLYTKTSDRVTRSHPVLGSKP